MDTPKVDGTIADGKVYYNGVGLPHYPPPSGGQKELAARLYILRNIRDELTLHIGQRSDTPDSRKAVASVQLLIEKLEKEQRPEEIVSAKNTLAIASFRAAADCFEEYLEKQLQGQDPMILRPLLQKGREFQTLAVQHLGEVRLERGREDRDKILPQITKELSDLVEAPFEDLLGEWYRRISKVILDIRKLGEISKELASSPELEEIKPWVERLTEAAENLAAAKRGSSKDYIWNGIFLKAAEKEILRRAEGDKLPEAVKKSPRMKLIACATRSIAWMARWDREDLTVMHEIESDAALVTDRAEAVRAERSAKSPRQH